jgi:DNA-binding MarR family transcriptional regulator
MESVPLAAGFMRRQMRGHRGGLSMSQFRTLLRVDREPLTSLSAVAEHLGSTLPTVSRIVTGLVDKGLVVRRGDQNGDRRRMSLTLTAQGRAVLARARRGTQRQMEQVLGELSPQRRKDLLEAMSILRDVFGPLVSRN